MVADHADHGPKFSRDRHDRPPSNRDAAGPVVAIIETSVASADDILIVETRPPALHDQSWVPRGYMPNSVAAFSAALIDETPPLFSVLAPDLFHLGVAADAWRQR